jgi:hypothetical protein
MTTRTLVLTAVLIAAGSGPVLAQPPTPPTPPAAPRAPRGGTPAAAPQAPAAPLPPAPPVPRREGQAVNVRVEFTITDQRSEGPATKRTVSVVVADNRTGQIRTQSEVIGLGGIPLNVDTTPELLTDGKIRLSFSLQYDWAAALNPVKSPVNSVATILK